MNGLPMDANMMSRMQQLVQQNPQLAMLLSKPGVMQKLQAIAQNPQDPMIAQQYASDPDVQQLMQILGPGLGIDPANSMGQFNNQFPTHPSQQSSSEQTVVHVNSENQFIDIIHKAPKTKLIVCDFFATWCGPCKAIAPDFLRFAQLYGKNAIFLKIDVDQNRELAQKKKIAAMPTFHLYKNRVKIAEMRGANSQKLEQLITQHISSPLGANPSQTKPSPYSNFPLHEKNRPIYTKAPFRKMKDKLQQLNAKFCEEEKLAADQSNVDAKTFSLDEAEMKLLTQIVSMLQDRASYMSQRFSAAHYKLLDKLLTWPSETLPPVLDLIRVLSLHPSFAEHLSKQFALLLNIIKTGGNGQVNAVNGMLTCRVVINLFNRRITAKVLEKQYTVVIDNLLGNMKVEERKNTRLAFVRVLLHYTYCFYMAGNEDTMARYCAEKIRCFSLCTEILYRETDEDIILNILMGIGTLLFRDRNVIQFAKSLDVEMVLKSYQQKYEKHPSIHTCCTELIQAIEKPNL